MRDPESGTAASPPAEKLLPFGCPWQGNDLDQLVALVLLA
jgi:hypothetical protein